MGAGAWRIAGGTAIAAATSAAANAKGNASVKLPKRGTTRVSAPSAICTTNAMPIAGAATRSATVTNVAANAGA